MALAFTRRAIKLAGRSFILIGCTSYLFYLSVSHRMQKKIKQHETWRYIYTLIALYIATVARILLMIQGLRVVHALMLLKIRKNEVMEIDRLLR